MLKDSFEGKIIRVDGLGKESLTCKIYHNNRQKEEYPPLTQQKSIHLSGQGLYTFQFTTPGQIKTVSLRLSLFSDDGAQWLPLFDSPITLETLPEETVAPRFLIVLCKSKVLHIIEESGEISEESSLSVSESEEPVEEEEKTPRDHQIIHTEEFLESIGSEFLDQSSIHEEPYEESSAVPNSEKLSRIWDKDNSALSENFEKNSFELFKEESSIRLAYEDLCAKYQEQISLTESKERKISEYEEKFVKLVENFKDQVKRSQDREESLIELVHEKENEVKTAQEEIVGLRSSNQKLIIEQNRLKDVNQGLLTELELCNPSPLLSEVQKLRTLVAELQGKLGKLDKMEEIEARLYEKDTVIHTLQRVIKKAKPSDSDTKESQNLSISILDELEDAVKAHSKAMNLPEPLIRDREQMYIYGNRKLSLMIMNGILMCRIGGTFKPFKEYMENFVLDTPIVKPLKKRFSVEQGIDSEYDADNFKEALNKSAKMTPKTTKAPVLKRKTRT